MRHIGVACAVGVVLLVSGCGGSSQTYSTQSTQQSHGPGPLPGYADCGVKRPQIKPTTLLDRCADGDFRIDGVDWSSWNHVTATGAGTGHLECAASCVPGDPEEFRIHLELSQPQTCATGSRPQFMLLTLRIIGRKPTHTGRTLSYRSNCPTP